MADGVYFGYVEAQVGAGVWKSRGRLHRPWLEQVARPGLTGAALEAAVDALSLRFPRQVH